MGLACALTRHPWHEPLVDLDAVVRVVGCPLVNRLRNSVWRPPEVSTDPGRLHGYKWLRCRLYRADVWRSVRRADGMEVGTQMHRRA